jgi:hypothetical protein
MDTTVLVDRDIENGQKAIDALSSSGLPVSAAMWLYYPEANEWRFKVSLASHEHSGPLELMQLIRTSLLKKLGQSFVTSFSDIFIISAKDDLLKTLRDYNRKYPKHLSNKRLTGNALNGKFIDDIYIYQVEQNQSREHSISSK